ncbi:hypothetical protein Goshw_022222 [Gossypium schwendimanii]|uniref:Uncharacterized protein n=1 Tax=Gossypium schwendimanii TaxID=34291 RepID=A0A7J9MUY3_GOSSC|nr:hypothetical protein [Gossypium schwendimanii]
MQVLQLRLIGTQFVQMQLQFM